MFKEESEKRSGTQTIERAVALIREICMSGHSGGQLSDIAARCGLRKSTAHRILSCLARERLVRQSPDNRHYLAGPMLFELGVSALPERAEFQHSIRNRLWALANQTSGVGFLFYRSGDEFVCAVRAGSAKCKAKEGLTIFPGTRRQLVLGTGGAAILIAMPEEEAREVIDRNLESLVGYSDTALEGIRHMLERSTGSDLAINEGDILPGVNAFGLALRDSSGVPYASIVLAGAADAFPLERVDDFRDLLHETAKA